MLDNKNIEKLEKLQNRLCFKKDVGTLNNNYSVNFNLDSQSNTINESLSVLIETTKSKNK